MASLDSDADDVIQPPQRPVLFINGPNSEKMNCKRMFNLFCLYGNVVRVKFFKNIDVNGVSMVQLGDFASCDRAVENINGSFFFGNIMLMGYSSIAIPDMPDYLLPDGTVSSADYLGHRHNRFTTPEAAAKNRILPPSKVLYFFDAPPDAHVTHLSELFTKRNVKPPIKIRIFKAKSKKTCTGLMEFDSEDECIEALVAANNCLMLNKRGNIDIYTLKLCFSDAPT